jgi:hypothetical protein
MLSAEQTTSYPNKEVFLAYHAEGKQNAEIQSIKDTAELNANFMENGFFRKEAFLPVGPVKPDGKVYGANKNNNGNDGSGIGNGDIIDARTVPMRAPLRG